jgi:hypothetical protein
MRYLKASAILAGTSLAVVGGFLLLGDHSPRVASVGLVAGLALCCLIALAYLLSGWSARS